MPPGDRAFFAAAAFVVGVAATHAFLGAAPQPLPWYFPVERAWRVTTTTDAVAMGWYATTAASWAGGAALAALAWLWARFVARESPRDPFAYHAWGWNAAILTAGAMALYFAVYQPW